MKYIKGFDTLRAFAVIFVVIGHWGMVLPDDSVYKKYLNGIIPTGQFGVTLFFVLSGFLITSILLQERNRNILEGGKRSKILKSFFVRRTLRIFPIYYLTIFLLYLVNWVYVRQHIGYYLLYLGNILPYNENLPNPVIHTWSLAVEEQFYLFWPWLILFINEKFLKWVFIIAIIIGITSKYVVIYLLHHKFDMLVINAFDAFGLGGMYAYMRFNQVKALAFDRAFKIIFVVMLYIALQINPIRGSPIAMIYLRTLQTVISLAFIMFVLNNKNLWIQKQILENRLLNFIGKMSYGLYLYHYVIDSYLEAFIKYALSGYTNLPIFFNTLAFLWILKAVFLFTLCWVSYTYIEMPILRLKSKFRYN